MTSFAKAKIFEKLENFREYLGYLHQLKEETGDETAFASDFRLFGNTERYLQLCIQSIIDVTHLLIIDLGKKRPEDNYEAISILREDGIVADELAHKLTSMVGLRNILVHEYGKIDRREIYKILTTRLEDFEEFQKQIFAYLDGKRL